jgi:hypothetical protein
VKQPRLLPGSLPSIGGRCSLVLLQKLFTSCGQQQRSRRCTLGVSSGGTRQKLRRQIGGAC